MKTIVILTAAGLALAACASPYADAIKSAVTDCNAGNQTACNGITSLRQADAEYHAAQREKAGQALAVMGAGLALGAAAYAASRPVYVPPPVFIPQAPQPVFCNSMAMGGGMVTTSCY
jgi:hypothetical protein